MAKDMGLLAGRSLGNCTLVQLIGQGGMGAVYLAQQTRPKRNVAVKILHPVLTTDTEHAEEFLARFRREGDLIARLEHIHIMPIYEYGEQDGLAYLVMPYLSGGSLRDILTRRGPLSLAETIPYIEQAASALDYAHSQGIIHRDLKPANFLLHSDGRLVLTDFGIARLMEEHTSSMPALTHTGMIVGTPDYMAPEMALGESIDYRVDIYELGIVLFQMLSGHVPFTGSSPYSIAMKHIQDPPPSLHQSNPTIPASVDAVIQKATAKRREDRYSSARDMARALSAASTAPHPTVPAPEPSTPAPTQPASHATTPSDAALEYDTTRNSAAPDWPHPKYNLIPPPPPQQYQPLAPIPYPQPSVARKNSPWMIATIVLLVLFIITGAAFATQKIISPQHPSPTPPIAARTAQNTTHTPVASTPVASAHTPVASTPTATVPPSTPTPTTSTTTTIPAGSQLYTTTSPGSTCDQHGGTWEDFQPQHVCQNQTTILTNTAATSHLGGAFLTTIPGANYPTSYVVQAHLQQASQSSTDFGLYFHNQPGAQAEGTYTLLIHPDNSWSADFYDNATGNPTRIASGAAAVSDIHAPVTLSVAINASRLSFYANNKLLGSVTDTTYPTGNAGIAINQGGILTISSFELDAIAP